jgi:Tfp pilus assembly protein PilF
MQAFFDDPCLADRRSSSSVPVTTLYDMLGVRPDADDETLKKAFRKAVKATHPDLHVGDAEALLRFRQIVIARDILRDTKQRAVYNRLLEREWERLRRRSKWKRVIIFEAIAVAVLAVVLVKRYTPLVPVPAIEVVKEDMATAGAPAKVDFDNAVGQIEIAPAHPAAQNNTTGRDEPLEKHEGAEVHNRAIEPSITSPATNSGDANMAIAVAAVKIDADIDNAVGQIEIAPAHPAAQNNTTGRDEPLEHEGAEVPNRAIEPSTTAPATNGDIQVIADQGPALSLPSNNAQFYRERGMALYRSGDFARAVVNFDEAIRLDPDDAQAYNIRGNAWDEMGVFERALADYDEAIRIDPNNPAVFHDRAILWQRKGALDKALVDLDRAIRFSFSDANIYCDRGLVWYEKGQHDRAVADFNQAIKIDPDLAVTCIRRGLILHRNIDLNLAFVTVERAIRIDPSIFEVTGRASWRR